MNEVLENVKLIKMYAWEEAFINQITGKYATQASNLICLGKYLVCAECEMGVNFSIYAIDILCFWFNLGV